MTILKKPPFMQEAGGTGRNIFAELGIAIVVFVAAQSLMGIVQSVGIGLGFFFDPELRKLIDETPSDPFAMFNEMMTAITSSLWVIIPMLYSNAFLIVSSIFYCKQFEKRKARSMGFVKKGAVPQYLIGILCGFAVFSAIFFICLLMGGVELSGFSEFTPEKIGILVLFFFGYLIQGMGEEVFCRGYLMSSISRRYSLTVGVLVSSLVFAVLHLSNPGISILAFINLFLYGVFSALLMIRFNNIWIAGAFHSLWNFTQGNFYGVSVSGMGSMPSVLVSAQTDAASFINGGAFGLEGGVCTSIVTFTGIVVLYIMIKLKEKKHASEKPQS